MIALNWQWFSYASAVAFAERRPALLSDANWDDAASARAFLARFPDGSSRGELISWLDRNDFEIDEASGTARRLVRGLPCNESIQVTWGTSPDGKLSDAQVTVMEAGCL